MAKRERSTAGPPGKVSRRLVSLAERLFADPTEQGQFILHAGGGQPGAARRCRLHPEIDPAAPAADWSPPLPLPAFVQPLPPRAEPGSRAAGHDRSSADPVTDTSYILDLSSVLAALPLMTLAPAGGRPGPARVLDLCAAPGGKAVFAWLALQPALLLANEVVGKRLAILRHNLARCRLPGDRVFTQRLDPAVLAGLAPGQFDLVICDAPCSGQSLPARGIDNPGAFHPATIQHNVRRQRRILAAAQALVAPGGHLLYTTCTFDPAENESNMRWLLRRFDHQWSAVDTAAHLPGLAPMRSPHADFPCHRFHPHQGHGGGGFSCLLRRQPGPHPTATDPLPAELTAWPVRVQVPVRAAPRVSA